jgi:transposase
MMSGDDVLMMRGASRVEVFTGSHRRRRWSREQKAAIVAESFETSVGAASDRHGVSKAQLFNWRREAREPANRLTFARIDVEPQTHGPAPGAAAPIEILTAGTMVRIRTGADPVLVRTIVGALKAVAL